MLLYALEIFNSWCKPGGMAVHCFAHLDQDVGEGRITEQAAVMTNDKNLAA